MVKQGPIPAFLHGFYEYLGGAALIALPLIIGYQHGAATAVSIVLGVLVIFLTATTGWTTGLIDQVPLPAHIILDYVLAGLLIASPFLFGFSGETSPTAVFIGGGVLHLLVSIATRYRRDDRPRRRRGKEKRLEAPGGEKPARERPPGKPAGGDEIPEFEVPPRPPRP